MWNKLWSLYRKYEDFVRYVFFGCCTTAVNYAVYFLSYYLFKIPNVPSDILAWIISVLFAFVTNKLFVFQSRTKKLKVVLFEFVSFVGCRALSGVVDVWLMHLTVDSLHLNAAVMKVAVSVVVAIMNYIASKLLVFSRRIRGRLSGPESGENGSQEQ